MLPLPAVALLCSALAAQTTLPDRNASLKQEIQLAISRGITFLNGQQNKETGIATLCMGGGNGLALAVKRVG